MVLNVGVTISGEGRGMRVDIRELGVAHGFNGRRFGRFIEAGGGSVGGIGRDSDTEGRERGERGSHVDG